MRCLLAACGGAQNGSGSAGTAPIDAAERSQPAATIEATALEGRWLITAFDDQRPAATGERTPSITFTRSGYGATAGCNALGGIGALHGARYYTMPGPQTLIGCLGTLAEQEKSLDAVMRAAPTITMSGSDLQLAGGGHRLTLRRDGAGVAPPVEAAPMLAGTRFQIMSVDGTFLTPRSQTDRRPLAFDAEAWRTTPVCAAISGKFSQKDWSLRASEIAVSRERCDDRDRAIDDAVRALLAADPNFSIGPNGEFLLAGGGHWLTAERDTIAAERESPPLAGSWDIVRLDGRPLRVDAPETSLPRIDFSPTGYTGSTGCNSILGRFIVRAGRLYTYPGPTTEKGCGSLSAQENRIYALLRGAPRIGRAGGDVQLVDNAGSIVIRRANRPANAGPAARPLPTRYAGTALSLNGEPTRNRITDPTSRITIAGNAIRIDIGCGVVSAVIRRGREGISIISNAGSSDGGKCTGARLAQHNQVMRLVNGPAAGIVDDNGDLLIAGEGVWLSARAN